MPDLPAPSAPVSDWEPESEPASRAARGNALDLLHNPSELLTRRYREMGPVFRLDTPWQQVTVIAGSEARDFIRQGLDRQYLTRDAMFAPVGRQLGEDNFVLARSGESHQSLREVLTLAYSRQVASAFVPDFIQATRDFVRKWEPGTMFSVQPEMEHLAFELYSRVLCGQSLDEHFADCLKIVDQNLHASGWMWPATTLAGTEYTAALDRVFTLMRRLVRERRANGPAPDRPSTMLDTLLRVRDVRGNQLTDDEVVAYAIYGFVPSCAYTARLISFMLYEITRDSELIEQLVAEIEQAFAEGMDDATDVRKLRLLQATYYETLRFHPVTQGQPFHAETDFVYEGKQIRKGDLTVLSQVPLSFSECPFSRPERFDPERCLEPRNEHRKEGAFLPFGMGSHACPATGLVELMALTRVVQLPTAHSGATRSRP
jgi:cytochrome P450